MTAKKPKTKQAQDDNLGLGIDEQEMGQLSVDVYELPGELVIIAPVAGIKLEDVNISLTEDVLTISGSRELEHKISKDGYLIQECFWGEFSRSIVLPDNINADKITASFKDGVLKITIPRTATGNATKLIRIKNS
jgi:HSP20 family protein